ncbi:MAG: tryptophan-rich sensory protein [Leptolyngbya sp. Prado105]|jgi:tryptophan-rich sensory protein|nr:tryptophan-rich sensory protein [Leptolyngbya sp. Prado105]
MKAWMMIVGITSLVALGSFLIRPREDLRWVKRLNLPRWLAVIEPAIPVIWTIVFSCGAGSAILIWQQNPGTLRTWLLMASYLLLEIVTVAYIPVTLRLQSLAIGTVLGGVGVGLGILLTIAVSFIHGGAGLLLLPYLLWSPIGTYATRKLINLNPEAI